jgi:hypothetical protein
MVVKSAPASERTTMSWPRKWMSRLPRPVYVPLATRTVSPAAVESMPAWIVGAAPGTRQVRAIEDPGRSAEQTPANAARQRSRFSAFHCRLYIRSLSRRLPAAGSR